MNLVPKDHPVLLGKANPIAFPDKDLTRIVCQMLRVMMNQGGCGLAAPQVGIQSRIITYRYEGQMGTMINPEITYRNPEMIDTNEACLSFPGEVYKTKRHRDIVVSFDDLDGKHHSDKKIEGFMAIIIQHECDHLEGVVLPQHGERQTIKP